MKNKIREKGRKEANKEGMKVNERNQRKNLEEGDVKFERKRKTAKKKQVKILFGGKVNCLDWGFIHTKNKLFTST